VTDTSPEDVTLTRTVREAGKLMGIDVLDHVVIGHGASLAQGTRPRIQLSRLSLNARAALLS